MRIYRRNKVDNDSVLIEFSLFEGEGNQYIKYLHIVRYQIEIRLLKNNKASKGCTARGFIDAKVREELFKDVMLKQGSG